MILQKSTWQVFVCLNSAVFTFLVSLVVLKKGRVFLLPQFIRNIKKSHSFIRKKYIEDDKVCIVEFNLDTNSRVQLRYHPNPPRSIPTSLTACEKGVVQTCNDFSLSLSHAQ